MAEKQNYYDILETVRTASEDEIKKAYRTAVKKYHPDINPGDPDALDKTKKINRAYEVLSDLRQRSLYDRTLNEAAYRETVMNSYSRPRYSQPQYAYEEPMDPPPTANRASLLFVIFGALIILTVINAVIAVPVVFIFNFTGFWRFMVFAFIIEIGVLVFLVVAVICSLFWDDISEKLIKKKLGRIVLAILLKAGHLIWRLLEIAAHILKALKYICIFGFIGFFIWFAVSIVSFFNSGIIANDVEIIIDNETYQAALSAWGKHDYIAAERLMLDAMNELVSKHGETGLETAEASFQIGIMYMELERFDKSRAHLTQALNIFSGRLKETDFKVVNAKVHLSVLDISTGNFETGIDGLIDLFNDTNAILHKRYIQRLIADMFIKIGNYNRALLLKNELAEYYANFAGFSNSYAAIINETGIIYFNGGEYENAVICALNAIASGRENEHVNDRLMSVFHLNLALYYAHNGQREETLKHYESALEYQNRFSKDDALAKAVIYRNMGRAYGALHEYDKQYEYFVLAKQTVADNYGAGHIMTADIDSYIAGYYASIMDYISAAEYSQAAINRFAEIYGPVHTAVAGEYAALAGYYAAQENHQQAIEAALECVSIYRELFGGGNIRTCRAYSVLARIYAGAGYLEQAAGYAQKSIDIIEDAERYTSIYAAKAYQVLGYIQMLCGQFAEAENNLIKANNMFFALKGKHQDEYARTLIYLGRLYLKQGETEQADIRFSEAYQIYEYIYPLRIPANLYDYFSESSDISKIVIETGGQN
jgi:tetratricopeptide (TPR) repeat protein